jgi:predicted small lipoprotein YifL
MMSRWNWASRRAKVLLVLVLAWTLAGCGRRAPTLALPVALPFDTITVEQTSPPAAVVL